MQWFGFSFHCMVTPSDETVNDFRPFFFLKESSYETINLPNTNLYGYGSTFEMKKDAICTKFLFFFFFLTISSLDKNCCV